jgi:hypothetical protein
VLAYHVPLSERDLELLTDDWMLYIIELVLHTKAVQPYHLPLSEEIWKSLRGALEAPASSGSFHVARPRSRGTCTQSCGEDENHISDRVYAKLTEQDGIVPCFMGERQGLRIRAGDWTKRGDATGAKYVMRSGYKTQAVCDAPYLLLNSAVQELVERARAVLGEARRRARALALAPAITTERFRSSDGT